MPRLRLIAGPNGSGKTTLTRQLREHFTIPLGQYLNPDDIARHISLTPVLNNLVPRLPAVTDYQLTYHAAVLAQKIALGLRDDWLRDRLSFSYESVMSHHSHLDFVDNAGKAGYKSYLYYVCTSDPAVNQARVKQRVELGGHNVPEEKIVQRYHRSLDFLYRMSCFCHRSYFFDNSTKALTFIAESTPDGFLDIVEQNFDKVSPSWFTQYVIERWDKKKIRISKV